MSAVIRLDGALSVVGELTGTGWQLPPTITREQWISAGAALSKIEQSKQWWQGDWWNSCQWGDGRDACEEIGVEYQTAQDCGMVCRSFEFSRRRENLTFTHHREVCAIEDPATRDRFLDWCLETNGSGKPRSTRELREAIREHLDEQAWTDEERARRDQLKDGQSIVVNQKTDERLIRWAQFNGVLTRIDRSTEWGNPFELPADGTRDEVCEHFQIYLSLKPSLQKKLATLKGKALACWCHPERCHGDHLASLANE